MKIEIHRRIPEDERIRAAWNDLVGRTERPEVFYTWEWAKAMEYAYAQERSPLLLMTWEGEALAGVVTLGLIGSRVEFLAATTADYCDFISLPEKRADFVDAALQELRRVGYREIVLTNLPAESATAAALKRRANQHGFHRFSRRAYECAVIQFGDASDRKDMRKTLEKKQWFRRKGKALRSEGEVALENLTAWEQIKPTLGDFARTHVSRFLSTGKVSNLVREERRLFLEELARRLCEREWLCLTRLVWRGEPIAWNYGFRFAGSWFWYQPAIEPELDRYSPGMMLLAKMVLESCDNADLDVLDLGLGAEGYKEQFANGIRETLHFTLTQSRAAQMRAVVRYGSAQMIKKWPVAERVVRQGLAKINRALTGKENADSPRVGGDAAAVLSSKTVYFRECDLSVSGAPERGETLQPVSWNMLADAAMQYSTDSDTLRFLLHSAELLRKKEYAGHGLTDGEGKILHILWSVPLGSLGSQKFAAFRAREPNVIVVVEMWTPHALRHRGNCLRALELLARGMNAKEKRTWLALQPEDEEKLSAAYKQQLPLRYSLNQNGTFVSGSADEKQGPAPPGELRETA